MVRQLLVWDCPEREYAMDRCHRHLLIPRGVQFTQDLFPQFLVLHNHATPYRDPKAGEEAPLLWVLSPVRIHCSAV